MEGHRGKGKLELYHEEDTGRESRDQEKAMWEAIMFELELMKEIQQKINDAEKQLWEKLDRETPHE